MKESRNSIRQANTADIGPLREILLEAVRWLEEEGEPLWREEDFPEEDLARDVQDGLYFLAECDDMAVGVVKFELSDELHWPDLPEDESVFLHRLAVRRSHAGGEVSSAILRWALDRAASLGRRYLRLDCAKRPKLQAVYERFGFRWHSDRQVGPWLVARYEYPVQLPPGAGESGTSS